MSEHVGAAPRSGLWVGVMVLRLVVLAGLAVDVYVHLHLAAGYDANTATISEGALFRGEAGVAGLAAVLVLLTRTQIGVVVVVAFLVAAGGVGAVLLYQYVDVGAVGPLPNMYEPLSYPEKTDSLIAEAVAALAALALLALHRASRTQHRGRV